MTTNQILMLIIVILVSIITVFGIYFLIVYLINKKKEKKVDTIFNPSNLVEEESLMNVMDEKKNVEFKKPENNTERFVSNNDEVKIITSETMSQEQKVNPFGVDLSLRTKEDGHKLEIQDGSNTNKFIK